MLGYFGMATISLVMGVFIHFYRWRYQLDQQYYHRLGLPDAAQQMALVVKEYTSYLWLCYGMVLVILSVGYIQGFYLK